MKVRDIVEKMDIGVAKRAINADIGSPLHALVLGLNQELIDRLGQSIQDYDLIASNRLKQSIITVDESVKGVISVAVQANFYWKYVQYGVNGTERNNGAPTWGKAPSGTPSFKEAILGWIRDRGIQAGPRQTYEQLASAMMVSLRKKGIQPRPFYTDVVNRELKEYLEASISAVVKRAIVIQIRDPWQ